MSDGKMLVTKITLSSGKVVLLRDLKIRDQDMAAKAAASRVGEDNKIAIAMAMQQELVKMLVVQIDDKPVKPIALEDLDSVFSYVEYRQLMSVLDKMTGGSGDMGNVKTEIVNFG